MKSTHAVPRGRGRSSFNFEARRAKTLPQMRISFALKNLNMNIGFLHKSLKKKKKKRYEARPPVALEARLVNELRRARTLAPREFLAAPRTGLAQTRARPRTPLPLCDPFDVSLPIASKRQRSESSRRRDGKQWSEVAIGHSMKS